MKTILNIKDKAVIISEKQAKLITIRQVQEIILDEKSLEHVGEPILFGNKKIYGTIELNAPQTINIEQFRNRQGRHQLTDKDRIKFLDDNEKLYAYSFKIKKIFKDPLDFVKSKDRGFLFDIDLEIENEKNIIDEYLNKLSYFKSIEVNKDDKFLKDCFVDLYSLFLEKFKVKKEKVHITEKYIRIRLLDPKTIVKNSFKTIIISKKEGIKAITGKIKEDKKEIVNVQSVLFIKNKWSVVKAKKWLKEHKKELI